MHCEEEESFHFTVRFDPSNRLGHAFVFVHAIGCLSSFILLCRDDVFFLSFFGFFMSGGGVGWNSRIDWLWLFSSFIPSFFLVLKLLCNETALIKVD